ncbi:hypothetical protein GH714_039459 [Hevea brasiliensis]|uniref:PB1 domain-containing protein n=1 Tax=Hevea brasiliensis TaxID=3981 RepID=A0A6A6NL39_HEVBR|nr:hypothetical protein GH714_039459 [Hevea brasiliensis]
MDPPPLPVPPLPATSATSIHINYPESVESSPRSHMAVDNFHESLPPVPSAKLRLMCSYGGHIIPRPHDKSLCYVGGETRIVVVDRHSSLSSLTSRLSRILLDGRSQFTLKYQLPHEDLDSLVSVTTDEDLDNMVEEYDRITSSASLALAPSRIRLFLFFNKPETAASMGPLLADSKSETWFVDALNGSGLFPRNLSDSATVDCLVNLDDEHRHHDFEAQAEGVEGAEGESKQEKNNVPVEVLHHDVQATMPDSPIVENCSSFGSSSSSPSMCNLPPIRVRVEGHHKVGVEEQFAQMTFAQVVQKQDDGCGLLSAALPPLPTAVAAVGNVATLNPAGGSSENLSRVLSDDEISDQTMFNQEQYQAALGDSRAPLNPDAKCEISVPSSQIQIQPAPNLGYGSPTQFDQQQQQQLVHTSTHFIPHPATTPLPISSYYPLYAPPPTPSQQVQPQQPLDTQSPVYVMPVAQTQTYMSAQSNIVETAATVITPSHPPSPPTPNIVAASAVYKDTLSHPPLYPTKAAGTSAVLAKPETAAGVYRTAVTSTPTFVPIPATQFQQQYVGYAPVQQLSQSIAVPAGANANYGFEYANATPEQVYYTHQIQASPLPSQYQTMTPAAAVALADASNQLPTSNTMHQIGTSQPL